MNEQRQCPQFTLIRPSHDLYNHIPHNEQFYSFISRLADKLNYCVKIKYDDSSRAMPIVEIKDQKGEFLVANVKGLEKHFDITYSSLESRFESRPIEEQPKQVVNF
jgi:hypothetical protein